MTSPCRASTKAMIHGSAALGAEQRVGLIDAFDEHGPASAVEPHRIGDERRVLLVTARLGVRIGLCGDLFGTQSARLVGVMSVVANEVLALVGDVLRECGEKVEGLEDLKIACGGAEEVSAAGVGEAMGSLFFGVVDDLAGSGDAEQAGETERAAGHVLGQAFDAVAVAGGEPDAAVDAEAGVSPGADLGDDLRVDAVFIQEQAQDVVLPDAKERFAGEGHREWEESAVGAESPVGDQAVDVGMEVHELAERLDGEDAAGCGILAEQRAVGLED